MTSDLDHATHLLNDRLTNAQSETPASLVDLLVFCKIAKVDKQLVKLVSRNACSEVLDVESEVDVGGFSCGLEFVIGCQLVVQIAKLRQVRLWLVVELARVFIEL